MVERLKFIAEVEDSEDSMTEICERFKISRKTGYKWLRRFKEEGPAALADRQPIALRIRHKMPLDLVARIIDVRKEHPSWGPKKIRAAIEEHCFWRVPAASSIGEVLKNYGLITEMKRRRRTPPSPFPLQTTTHPNETWCVDFKGHFPLQDGTRCYPFTLSDHETRYLLKCEALDRPDYKRVRLHCEQAFHEFGLPDRMRSDNGPPFATNAIGGLSKLSIWWIKLGIIPERIEPGHPEQNGRHERVHRTMEEVPRQKGMIEQRLAYTRFRSIFNDVRPHEALDQKPPVRFYRPSARRMPIKISDVEYPATLEVRRLDEDGRVRFRGSSNTLVSRLLAGELVGLELVNNDLWRVHFGPIAIAFLEVRNRVLRLRRLDDGAPLAHR